MELHLKIVGVAMVLLAAVHAIFPRYFNWKEELSSLSLINREVMYVHTFFIALVVAMMGVLSFTSASELVGTALGQKIALGFGIFWLCRLFIQFFGYSSSLWKGKSFETTIHVVFSLMWTYFSGVYCYVYIDGL